MNPTGALTGAFETDGSRPVAVAVLPCLLLVAALLPGCGPGESRGGKSEQAAGPAPRAEAAPVDSRGAAHTATPAPSWDEAANARYAGPVGEAFRLVDGDWRGPSYVEGGVAAPRAGLVRDFLLTADLDGDGDPESVVLVWTSGGGSGTYDHLVVLDRDASGVAAERASAPLGDRVKVRTATVTGGAIVVETVQAGPGDAACCPGQNYRRTFVLTGDTLEESDTEDQGRLSIADLQGQWRLQSLAGESDVPVGVEIMLRFQGDRIAGHSGCNRYTGVVVGGERPGTLSLAGPTAGTRMMCPEPNMHWEDRFLEALGGLSGFSFRAGRLVLTCQVGELPAQLEFERVAADD